MSEETRVLAGVLLLALVTVETGGLYLLNLWRSRGGRHRLPDGFRASRSCARRRSSGAVPHGPAVRRHGRPVRDLELARPGTGVPVAAILMPAGFFFSSMGQGRTQPNRLVGLIFAGATVLALGLASLGIGLLTGLTTLAWNPRTGSWSTSGAGPGATR